MAGLARARGSPARRWLTGRLRPSVGSSSWSRHQASCKTTWSSLVKLTHVGMKQLRVPWVRAINGFHAGETFAYRKPCYRMFVRDPEKVLSLRAHFDIPRSFGLRLVPASTLQFSLLHSASGVNQGCV
eukprot:6486612-Amphidinium_carterae.1